jgi:hypothetical protein
MRRVVRWLGEEWRAVARAPLALFVFFALGFVSGCAFVVWYYG